MRYTSILPALILAVLLGCAASAFAQSSGMFGNSSTRQLGGGLSPGTSNFGGSGSGGSGAMGQSGMSQGGAGQGGLAGATGQGAFGQTNPNGVGGQARRSGSFVGANTGQQAQRNFVGASQANNQNGTGQNGQGNFNSFGGGGMGGFGRALLQNALSQNRSGASSAPQIRTTLRLGSELTAAVPPVNTAIAEHLVALPALHWTARPSVEMQGRTAVLRGAVATEHDRDLAARVVRLEATVDHVQNLLEVAGPAKPK